MAKFNKELAKKVSLETTNVSDGPSDSKGIEIKSGFKAIDRGLDGQWIKAKWKSNSVGWQSWSHPGTDRIPEWSKMDDAEIVDMVFDGRIIETLDHEALIRNVGGNV